MRNLFATRLLVLIGLVLAGCVSVGRDFDIAKADQLIPGVSTEADAKRLLGEPITVQRNPENRHDLFIWQNVYGTGLGTGGGQKLAISFDEKGKMIAILQRTKL
jgi:hypothetical protein